MKKMTKKEMYEVIIGAMETGELNVKPDVVIDFCQNEIALLDKKAAKAKARAAEKRAEADELTEEIKKVLTEEYQTIADITGAVAEIVGADAVSTHKVSYRLTQLVKSEYAEDSTVKIPGGEGQKTRSVKGFKVKSIEE